ncbi:UNVERIFIED_CONTAM: hypothetical protein GTU68_008059 [Idotea baltica]|nr:hypothetical protein [Idotea baltica]
MVAIEDQVEEKTENKFPIFRNPDFKHSALRMSKKRVWKNLKQVLALEKSYIWPLEAVNYSHIEAPPSFTPAKRYSDVSGLPAKYTDPLTKLRYSTTSEYYHVRNLSMDIVNGLLEIRKASSIVG